MDAIGIMLIVFGVASFWLAYGFWACHDELEIYAVFSIFAGIIFIISGMMCIAHRETNHMDANYSEYYVVNITEKQKCELSDMADNVVNLSSVSVNDMAGYARSSSGISTITFWFDDTTDKDVVGRVGDDLIACLSFKNSVFKYWEDANKALCKSNGGQWSDKMNECLDCEAQ